jgi:hypothetical protein
VNIAPTEKKSTLQLRRERDRLVIKMIMENVKTRQIANALGITRTRVTAITKRLGIPISEYGRRGKTVRSSHWEPERVATEYERLALEDGISKGAKQAQYLKALIDYPSERRRLDDKIQRDQAIAAKPKTKKDAR